MRSINFLLTYFLETGLSKAEILRLFAFQIGSRRHLLGGNKTAAAAAALSSISDPSSTSCEMNEDTGIYRC